MPSLLYVITADTLTGGCGVTVAAHAHRKASPQGTTPYRSPLGPRRTQSTRNQLARNPRGMRYTALINAISSPDGWLIVGALYIR